MIGWSSYVSSGMLIGRDVKVEVVEESKPAAIDLGSTLLEEEQTKTPPLVRNIKSVDDFKEELWRWVEMGEIILLFIVTLKCHDNRYEREIFSIIISSTRYYHKHHDYCKIHCSETYISVKCFLHVIFTVLVAVVMLQD